MPTKHGDMGQPSQQLIDRYKLKLDANWVDWFDDESDRIRPAGAMRSKISTADLCARAPMQIWPGFMLPDTLPIVGNDYGDWICARVTENGSLGELIYWYHGGGDWIPVGNCLAEALLHDVIDQFRGKRAQMLRGAPETLAKSEIEVSRRLEDPRFQSWIVKQLTSIDKLEEANAEQVVGQVLGHLEQRRSQAALELLSRNRLAEDAIACDLIELALQFPVEPLAQNEIANQLEIPWYPNFARLLFDVEAASPELRTSILAHLPGLNDWPRQDWIAAGRLAEDVLARRSDLGWAFTVAGWAQQRQGAAAAAMSIYWDGRFASSFADQSVRLNSHGLAEQSGKFSIEQLVANSHQLIPEQLADPYLTLFLQTHTCSLLVEVHDYWWRQALERHHASDFAAAYDCFFRSGWDLGVSRLSDYGRILRALAETAKAAGWAARASVAETHLACLERR